jgi:hypothetical protein
MSFHVGSRKALEIETEIVQPTVANTDDLTIVALTCLAFFNHS